MGKPESSKLMDQIVENQKKKNDKAREQAMKALGKEK
ncbi:BH1761 [Halalkalibacterium halodurans C-125]|jgi:hypothetical protein|uniref:BH1761 protein n=1 Tax=Halalkalibacterium halodurans (strain ATCC BAA-125 / DSM 18197 / FERM 7344 / JCM 9153 / C-125) TaxID=272558 RepID=Q9KC13_HALH5|nr:BH1761 [Halalkalibacterium halodurans C-125]